MFAPYGEASHYVLTFRLARALRARGHDVVYLTLADLAPVVRRAGFRALPFAPDLLPAGSRALFGASAPRPRGAAARLGRWRDERRFFTAYLARMEGGELDGLLRDAAPDLLLCDAFYWWVALRALRLRIPVVNVSGNLALAANARVPPLTSYLRPSGGRGSALRVRTAWAGARFRLAIDGRLAGLWKGTLHCPARMHRLRSVFRRAAARAGYACVAHRTFRQTEFGPRLALPELALCPAALQLPGAPDVGRRHLDDVVDRDRAEEPLGAELDPAKPLVYCSLGSAAEIYPDAARCFRAVVAASAARPDWQVVLHVGDWEGALPSPPPNLVVRRRVPQLALLRRAAVMVTHGGMNSIVECVAFGVPMVVLASGLRDHPGNAVRAAHHRLAVTTRMAGITAERLVALIEQARTTPALRDGLARMQRTIAAGRGVPETVGWLEGVARGARDVSPDAAVR